MNQTTREVLDFPCMERDTPQYETIRGHYLFSGLDEGCLRILRKDGVLFRVHCREEAR